MLVFKDVYNNIQDYLPNAKGQDIYSAINRAIGDLNSKNFVNEKTEALRVSAIYYPAGLLTARPSIIDLSQSEQQIMKVIGVQDASGYGLTRRDVQGESINQFASAGDYKYEQIGTDVYVFPSQTIFTGSADLTTDKIARISGSWIVDGYKIGNCIVVWSPDVNYVVFRIVTITALEITVRPSELVAGDNIVTVVTPAYTITSYQSLPKFTDYPDSVDINIKDSFRSAIEYLTLSILYRQNAYKDDQQAVNYLTLYNEQIKELYNNELTYKEKV